MHTEVKGDFHIEPLEGQHEGHVWVDEASDHDSGGNGSRLAIEHGIYHGRMKRSSGGKPMKRYVVEGLADVGAVLFEIVEKYEKTGFAEARMIPKDLKTARYIVDGYLNYVRGRHKRSKVIIKRLSLVFEKGRGDQIGSFILGMGKPPARAK